jgi:LuxR family maltose regulon positive regulatory protein
VALAALPLSAILYESNDTKRAEEILARQLANATDWGIVDQFVAGYVTQVRILALHGEEEEALQLIDEGTALALDRNLQRLRMALLAEQLRILSVSPSTSRSQVIQHGEAAGLDVADEAVLAQAKSRAEDEFRAIAWFRVAMAKDDLQGAVHVAKSWRRFCEARGAQLSHVRWGILLAEAQLQLGDIRSAQRVLREAIAVAAPIGVCRSFLDEGQVIYTLVENCCQAKAGSNHPTDLYALQLLEAFGGKLKGAAADDEEVVYSSLSDREVEVLLQVSLGMRNREVAERLGMTEGSIKWYMQQIFDKLGTRSRLQAVERARKFGLIG